MRYCLVLVSLLVFCHQSFAEKLTCQSVSDNNKDFAAETKRRFDPSVVNNGRKYAYIKAVTRGIPILQEIQRYDANVKKVRKERFEQVFSIALISAQMGC